MRVPWAARRYNQSILREISHEYSLKGLMLSLKFQHFGYLMWKLTHWKRPWCWERLKAGGEGDIRAWGGILTWWTCVWASSGSWWWIGKTVMLQSMGSQRVGQDWATKLKLNCYFSSPVLMVCFAFMVVFDSLRKLNYYLLLFWNC